MKLNLNEKPEIIWRIKDGFSILSMALCFDVGTSTAERINSRRQGQKDKEAGEKKRPIENGERFIKKRKPWFYKGISNKNGIN